MAKDTLVRSKTNPERTRMVSASEAKVLVRLGRWEYPTGALEAGPPKRRERPAADPLEGVAFASPAAQEAAQGLAAAAFAGRTGSGKDGAFTKADITEIAAKA